MRYFKKELFSTKLYLPSGSAVPFSNIGFDTGILATEDGYVLKELDKCLKKKIGGVVELSQNDYEELKKNSLTNLRSQPYSRPEVNSLVAHLFTSPQKSEAAAASEPAPIVRDSEPLKVPDKLPVVRKIRKSKAPEPAE